MSTFWPNGAQAAVSLTYDDGKESHLDVALADLAGFGAMATFFLTPGLNRVTERAAEWRQVAAAGHEIANHTMHHRLTYQTAAEFAAQEIVPCETWLDAQFGPDRERTFTYPYGRLVLENGTDYSSTVKGKFLAARGGNGGPVTAKDAMANRFDVPAAATTWANDSPDSSIAHMDAALQIENGWSVLLFHDVYEQGKPWEGDTNRSVHRDILRYATSSPKFWVAPFREVFRHIVSRLG